jgi:hypothetical protein
MFKKSIVLPGVEIPSKDFLNISLKKNITKGIKEKGFAVSFQKFIRNTKNEQETSIINSLQW